MGFGFELVLLDEGKRVTLYSFCKDGESQTELEKFWEKDDVQRWPDCRNLETRLYEEVLDAYNFEHRNCFTGQHPWFHNAESTSSGKDAPGVEALCALMEQGDYKRLQQRYGDRKVPVLRLYCFRMRKILIAGNGKIKKDERIHDDPDLKSLRNDVRYVRDRVYERMQRGLLNFEEYEFDDGYVEDEYLLEGNLHFEAPTYP